MLPLSAEYVIREAVQILAASRRTFRSRQVERARELLELLLREQGRLPWPPTKRDQDGGGSCNTSR